MLKKGDKLKCTFASHLEKYTKGNTYEVHKFNPPSNLIAYSFELINDEGKVHFPLLSTFKRV